MLRVDAANGGGEMRHPATGDVRSRPILLVEGDELDEVLSGEGGPEPLTRLPLAARDDRLVHEVVTENGGRILAPVRDRNPETGLRIPAPGLIESIIPRGHIGLVVAPQSGEIEIETFALGQRQQLSELVKGGGVRLVGSEHEPAELKVDADDIRAELLDLGEVFLHSRPLFDPVVLDEPARRSRGRS